MSVVSLFEMLGVGNGSIKDSFIYSFIFWVYPIDQSEVFQKKPEIFIEKKKKRPELKLGQFMSCFCIKLLPLLASSSSTLR